MCGRAYDVDMQLSEIEMLQSMFPVEGEVVFDDELVFIETKRFVRDGKEDPCKPLEIVLKLELQDRNCILRVSLVLPVNYPSEESVKVLVRSQSMSKLQYKDMNEDITKFVQDLGVGDLQIFQIIEWLNENGPKYVTSEPETSSPELKSTATMPQGPRKFSRFWIYSHHIYSKEKRKNILEWSKELELTGFSMPGKPGVVCVEGPQDNCEEFWQRMKKQTWKRLNLVHREDGMIVTSSGESTFIPKFLEAVTEKDFGVHGGRDYHMDLGQFASFLTDHQCHNLFAILFGVEGRSKSDDKAG